LQRPPQLGGEAPHRAHHEVDAPAARAPPGRAAGRLDEEHPAGAGRRRVVAGELVAEDERGVAGAHPALTAR